MDEPFLAVTFPELTCLRNAARLVAVDAQLAARGGDGARAYEDLQSMLLIAEHASETPLVVPDLVAIGIVNLQTCTIGSLLSEHAELFSDTQLVRLSHGLAGALGGGRLQVRFLSERWMFEDIIQRLYTDDGAGNGHLCADAPTLLASISNSGASEVGADLASRLLAPALVAVLADRREMLRKYDEFMAAFEAEARLPLWERGESIAEGEATRLLASRLTGIRYLPITILMPSLSHTSVHAELATQRRDAALSVLACELYRRDHGQWPATLAELSPQYLPSPPVDRFDGEPLRYRLVDGRPLMYSIGRDLDDDGGRAPQDPSDRRLIRDWLPPSEVAALKAGNSAELPDGDWILWPPGE